MLSVSNPLVLARRNYGLLAFRFADHSKASIVYSTMLSLLSAPAGLIVIYYAYKNEKHHREKMKGKVEFIPTYPREIRKLPWGNGKTGFTDNILKSLSVKPPHEIAVPRLADLFTFTLCSL
ncbi:hypothetical protein EWB00_010420 [Schistosoma japonicum]|uniref:Uncharacterized protein n=3 Tax=Schistosoma japonicum TaxID=6182 RepID=A0A4Z2DXS4_SCHJA|nr:hypothetical protein KSF78_0005353 [Schistosoma japonicum]TNN21247.1 hypothetical protein EWB00_010420 [Schistosoma japonicum]